MINSSSHQTLIHQTIIQTDHLIATATMVLTSKTKHKSPHHVKPATVSMSLNNLQFLLIGRVARWRENAVREQSEKTGHDRQVEVIVQTATDQSTATCHQLRVSERTIQLLRKPADLIISTRRQTHRSTRMRVVDHSESHQIYSG